MSQTNAPRLQFDAETFKKLIAFLIALVTVFITIVSYLQNDAGSRDDAANRDSKNYSLEAMGQRVSGDARVNFDYNRAYQAYYEYELLATAAENAGDTAAAERYWALQEQMRGLSPLLQAPYFDPETGVLDTARYESDTYLVATTALSERFTAASSVKDAWDTKANTYIIHITFLAVALFLYGMATTLSGRWTPWVFTGVGTALTIFTVGWVIAVFALPVPDLRTCIAADGTPAIDAYAQGVGLAYQERYEEAVSSLDKAVQCRPDYVNALIERGNARAALGNLGDAAIDYEKARAFGASGSSLAGDLAYTYYLLGRFDDASAMNQTALQASPDELWIRFDEGLNLLAAGKIEAAQAEYQKGMDSAARQVADAKAAAAEPPSWLWWGLEDAAEGLDDLIDTIETGEGNPALQAIINAQAVSPAAQTLIKQLKSLSVALEYTGAPVANVTTAKLGELSFAEPQYDDAGEIVDYTVDDEFDYGVDEISVLFDYNDVQDGQMLVFKVYIDGEEDPSWRVMQAWDLGSTGSAEIPISLSYSNSSVLDSGLYTVEVYIDSQLLGRNWFSVLSE